MPVAFDARCCGLRTYPIRWRSLLVGLMLHNSLLMASVAIGLGRGQEGVRSEVFTGEKKADRKPRWLVPVHFVGCN